MKESKRFFCEQRNQVWCPKSVWKSSRAKQTYLVPHLEPYMVQNGWMARRFHIAFAIAYTQYTIQLFYCQMGNNISLHFVYLGILEAWFGLSFQQCSATKTLAETETVTYEFQPISVCLGNSSACITPFKTPELTKLSSRLVIINLTVKWLNCILCICASKCNM